MEQQKLLFIIPARPDFVPYVFNYFQLADECAQDYDVVCWNRRGEELAKFSKDYMVYNHPTSDRFSPLKKLLEIYGFYRFVRRSVKGRKYHAIFTFTIAESIFFAPWLIRCFDKKFVFDIRDYSPLVNNVFSSWLIKRMLDHSAMNVISSGGFLSWLPKDYSYVICHNTDIKKVKESIDGCDKRIFDGNLKFLTIGNLRDAAANRTVVDKLANRRDVQMIFSGGGAVSDGLQKHCEIHDINNAVFTGRYRKEDEDNMVRGCDMMNIMLPHDPVADHLMSNRFYLSVRLRKPMVVNNGCFQAEQVKKYGLGLVISEGEDLYSRMINYWNSLDWIEYNEGCVKFLKVVQQELDIFKQRVFQVMK